MYKYTHFIPENIAPVGAQKIGVYDSNGRRVGSFGLGKLTPPNDTKLYSFCAISDVHIGKSKDEASASPPNQDFQRALTYANAYCDFTCICGDLVETGGNENLLITYKNIVDTYSPNKPVYAIAGNHENYDGYSDAYLENYTGHPLYYSFTKGNDVFIMVGHFGAYRGDGIGWLSSEFVSVEELQWLYETLEANRNKRCFIFNHVYPYEDGVGDANRLYNGRYWKTTDGSIGEAYINLLKHYKNTILFHGHSHIRFYLQELDKKANYSSEVGYRSIHIPSLSVPRDKIGSSLEYAFSESEGYIVDVYDNYIILNGRDFIDNDKDGHGIGIATYKIDTTLQTIEANAFTDSTGTITT